MRVTLLKCSEPPPNLLFGKVYCVVGVDQYYFRIVNEIGEPCLYEKESFEVLDHSLPPAWVRREYDDGEYHVDPPEVAEIGFYERWFDGDPAARAVFGGVLETLMRDEGEVLPSEDE